MYLLNNYIALNYAFMLFTLLHFNAETRILFCICVTMDRCLTLNDTGAYTSKMAAATVEWHK